MALLWMVLLFTTIEVVLAVHLVVYREELNWFVAQWKCSQRGGSLVSPNSTYIQQELVAAANASTDYWIGISLGTRGWSFDSDESQLKTGNDSNDQWHPGEPNFECTDHCVRMIFTQDIKPNHTMASWRTTYCKLKYEYVCQFDQGPPTEQATDGTTVALVETTVTRKPKKIPTCKRRAVPAATGRSATVHVGTLGGLAYDQFYGLLVTWLPIAVYYGI